MTASRAPLPHARERLPEWTARWSQAGRLVLLLDFDGTLAPIVPRADQAAVSEETAATLRALVARDDLDIAVVSGRGLADVRRRLRLEEIAYAGNHGMEIEGPGLREIHSEAAAARPQLQEVRDRLEADLGGIDGAFVEDKELTLSIHYRLAERAEVPKVRERVAAAVADHPNLRITEGKEIFEVRPRVDWHKGRAVEFLLDHLSPPPGTPVLYIGDDVTDEDAFRALRARGDGLGEGVLVLEGDVEEAETAAASYVRSPAEAAELLEALLRHGR